MTELVIMKNQQAVTSSLQIAEVFERNHRDVLKAIDDLKEGVAENYADLFSEDTYIHPQNKQTYRQIIMTRDGFTLLAMGFTGKEALRFKLKYIAAFNEMEERLKKSLPSTFAESLRLAYLQQLEIEEKSKQIEVLAPKADYFDKAIDRNGMSNFRDTAKILGLKQNQFIKWLLFKGYLYRDRKNRLKPYAEYDHKYFEIKDLSERNSSAGFQTMVTALGRSRFNELINGERGSSK